MRKMSKILNSRSMLIQPENVGFRDVIFTYPMSHSVNLDDIKLHLNRGDTLGIVGKTGSGKTTFVKQLLREYPLEKGKSSFQAYHFSQ